MRPMTYAYTQGQTPMYQPAHPTAMHSYPIVHQQSVQYAHHPFPNELDSQYSANMLQQLGYSLDYDPNNTAGPEWYVQAMGPSASVGML